MRPKRTCPPTQRPSSPCKGSSCEVQLVHTSHREISELALLSPNTRHCARDLCGTTYKSVRRGETSTSILPEQRLSIHSKRPHSSSSISRYRAVHLEDPRRWLTLFLPTRPRELPESRYGGKATSSIELTATAPRRALCDRGSPRVEPTISR